MAEISSGDCGSVQSEIISAVVLAGTRERNWTHVVLDVALVVDLDLRLAGLGGNLERPVLEVLLDVLLVKLASDKTLGIEDSVASVLRSLVLGGVSDKALLVGEGDPRGGDTVAWKGD